MSKRKSHVADWVSNSPTPAQLKEFFSQIERRRITKNNLQIFLRGSFETVNELRAKKIMTKNMIKIEDVSKHLNLVFSKNQLDRLAEVPFTEAILQECKDTHILFPGHPLTILEIRERVAKELFYSHENAWYNKQNFARKTKVECKWYLIRKDEVPNSFNKTFKEQKELLKESEEIPYVCELVYMAILHKLAKGEYLFPNYYVRCQDLDSVGRRVDVGGFVSKGLCVNVYWAGHCYSGVGLSASWKFQIDC